MLNELAADIYRSNCEAGWWAEGDAENPLIIATKICLVHSEVSEMMEGERKGLMDDKLPHRPMGEVECADAIIRLLDLAGARGWDVQGALDEKRAFNAQRIDHKREHRDADGGKKY